MTDCYQPCDSLLQVAQFLIELYMVEAELVEVLSQPNFGGWMVHYRHTKRLEWL